jgi:hypothetical protein
LSPTNGLQEKPMDYSFKQKLNEILVHRICHQLPKTNIGAKYPYRRLSGAISN